MNYTQYIQYILLGIIEGITEFFPISSTGHMILIASMMGILEKKITNLFLISVQMGAVFSVVFFYRKKLFFQSWDFYIKILIASFPIGIFGFLLKNIPNFLYNPLIVAISIFIGGIVLLLVENYYVKNFFYKSNCITYFQSFIIGISQCLAIIPGISRSATTITTCMLQNIHRIHAMEFSFFLSIPVIIMATCKKLFDYYFKLTYFNFPFNFRLFLIYPIKSRELFLQEIGLLIIGNIVAFITGIISIKYFMFFLKKNNFKLFGYYRMILGLFFIFLHYIKKR
ncbi:undecaprenyl-diphosphate phosphatase [Blattabacterium cuenoti]|uniref:undecaprenyl-diphosphate phosphatase n=1 Tax=Blattabacterium cuenoti TaxID=1653831 RepID=UPI00163D1CC1|nr:undecaprenyl-diphosphate phosphatase [Blattabacterium cuenoti]